MLQKQQEICISLNDFAYLFPGKMETKNPNAKVIPFVLVGKLITKKIEEGRHL